MYQRILVPTDGSELAAKAVSAAVQLAKLVGAKVYALSVKEPFAFNALSEYQPAPPPSYYEQQETLALQRVGAVQEACQGAAVACQVSTIESINPWEAIIDHARDHQCDLIVMGSHGRRGMAALLLGSETQKVLTHCKLPVLVVR
jgi:nucleotide-binding universal stress UspA family protein